MTMRLALFDLDHTLLSADSDVLWCQFLIDEGRLVDEFALQYRAIAQRYDAGTITPVDYCDFHAATLAGFAPAELLPLRERFFNERVRPRIPDDARHLLQGCRERAISPMCCRYDLSAWSLSEVWRINDSPECRVGPGHGGKNRRFRDVALCPPPVALEPPLRHDFQCRSREDRQVLECAVRIGLR